MEQAMPVPDLKENAREEVAVSALRKGDALNWAVHKALGLDLTLFQHKGQLHLMDASSGGMPMPFGAMNLFSESWKDGGRIVDELLASGQWQANGIDGCGVSFTKNDGSIAAIGVDTLEAACRAKVESVLGAVIAVPSYFLR